MNDAHFDIEAFDDAELQIASKGVVEAERQVRISLAADWPRNVQLPWHPGPLGRLSIINLAPGKSVVQPLHRAQCWFGPFAIPQEFFLTTDEKKRDRLRQFYADEKKRYLDKYDYPRGERGARPDMRPVGPHRSPDVTVTIIDPDGIEHEPIRLYKMYKLGEFDPLKDTFVTRETPEEIEARYKAELDEKETEMRSMRRELANLAGMVKGLAISASGAKHEAEKATA